jgi:anti-anti-sigma regulatory factor
MLACNLPKHPAEDLAVPSLPAASPPERAMKFYLIVAKGKHQGLPIPITVDLFLMGSDRMCQLRSPLPGVARQHCALVTRGRKVFVRDLGGDQPTQVNQELVPPGEEWPLHAGDRLGVGPLEFLVQFREKPLSQRDLEEWALKCLDRTSERELDDPEDAGDPIAALRRRPTTASQAAAMIMDKLQARRGVVKGRLRIGLEAGVTTVRFNDIYLVEEAELALVKKELFDNLGRPNLRVLLDFKNVKRMSSTAVAIIRELHGWLRPWGSTLALCRLRPELQGMLQTLSLDAAVRYFPDKKAAYATRW